MAVVPRDQRKQPENAYKFDMHITDMAGYNEKSVETGLAVTKSLPTIAQTTIPYIHPACRSVSKRERRVMGQY